MQAQQAQQAQQASTDAAAMLQQETRLQAMLDQKRKQVELAALNAQIKVGVPGQAVAAE